MTDVIDTRCANRRHPVPDDHTLLQALRHDGVVVLPGLYQSCTEALLAEHQRATSGHCDALSPPFVMDGERIHAASRDELQAAGLPALLGILSAPWFVRLAAAYLGQSPAVPDMFSLALDRAKQDIDGPGNHHLHWDPTLSLRMMLYVSDVTRANGALEIKRGTHRDNHQHRLAEWAAGQPYRERPACAGDGLACEAVEAPAGSVLVFDTSITHRRGLLRPGQVRRAAFAHCHSTLARQQLAGAALSDIAPALHWPHLSPPDTALP